MMVQDIERLVVLCDDTVGPASDRARGEAGPSEHCFAICDTQDSLTNDVQ